MTRVGSDYWARHERKKMELAQRARAGMSVPEIAKKMGLDRDSIKNGLALIGIEAKGGE